MTYTALTANTLTKFEKLVDIATLTDEQIKKIEYCAYCANMGADSDAQAWERFCAIIKNRLDIDLLKIEKERQITKAQYNQIKNLVQRFGGCREKSILQNPHEAVKTETWNASRKVVDILEANPDIDGHRNGFSVDLITMTICG